MIIAHMKSGKTHKLDMDMPTFEELNQNQRFDAIAAGNAINEMSVHILPKDNIESIEVIWDGTLEELNEAAKKYINKN
jgi:galactose-1-phosphate uridylyltransferase